MIRKALFFTLVFFLIWSDSCGDAVEAIEASDTASEIPLGVIDDALLPIGYSGREKLVYDVSWSGGIKIGEIHLAITSLAGGDQSFEIRAQITTRNGAIHLIYPIDDLHVTRVRGAKRLPFHYEVWQKEGWSYEAHRIVQYDQKTGYIRYTKNDKLVGEYRVAGEVNNEFSSFFNSRLMKFQPGREFMVPTFADKRRVDVAVHVKGREKLDDTLFGSVTTIAVMPIMTFKGLYEKKGDTVIWYTDDECRVPLRIKSKIKLGSLTAELTAYQNPAADCFR